MNCWLKTKPSAGHIALEGLITMEELFKAIKQGKPCKAPGHEGISPEFIKKNTGDDKISSTPNNEHV